MKDRKFLIKALKQNAYVLETFDEDIKKDREITIEAVKQNGLSLEHAADDFKKDREIVLTAIKNHAGWDYIDYLDQSFIEDKDFVIEAISVS